MKKFLLSLLVFLSLFSFAIAEPILAFEELEYSVFVKKSKTLSPVKQGIQSKLTYTWESSDTDVAKVSKGKVTGVSVGSATITCTGKSKKGEEYVASCIVHVSKPVTKITTNITEASLAASVWVSGEIPYSVITPEILVEPEDATNKDVVWSTSDNLVARVDENGKITAYHTGKATVTCEAADGSGVKAKIKIVVPDLLYTSEKIVIDSPDGFVFGYQQNGSGISTFGKSGEAFYTEPMDDQYGLCWIKLVPQKAGEGALVFTLNGSRKKIPVTVKHSAVFDEVSYPKGSMTTEIGKKASYTGTVLTANLEGTSMIKLSSSEYVFFESDDSTRVQPGYNITLYGTVINYDTYQSETGLQYECPVLEIAKIWRNSK